MDSLRLPDYYIDSNGLPNILNNKQQMLKRPSINHQNTSILNNSKTKCTCSNTVKTKQHTRQQDATEIDTLIVRPNIQEIKNIILSQHRTTDAGLNKKIKCLYNEMKKKHMENKASIQIKDQNIIHRNHENFNS